MAVRRARLRGAAMATIAGLLLTACSGTSSDGSRAGRTPVRTTQLPQADVSPEEDVPSALADIRAAGLPEPLVDPDTILDGGPPPDGIPALADARFQGADSVGWLTPDEPVLSLTVGGETRAYPVQILVWHEIVNDTVGGVPVAVTYCPLCNSAIAFERRVAGRVVTFGTSGKLYNSDLVMYDRQTRSLWPQLEGRAVAGVLTGTTLVPHVVQTVAWKDWLAAHPTAWVLSRDTGHARQYGINPYQGYDAPGSNPFAFTGKVDSRLPPKTRVVALGGLGWAAGADDAVAVTYERLRSSGVMEVRFAGGDVVLWLRPGLRSALDAADLPRGRQVGAIGAFDPTWRGRRLHFTASDGGFTDAETGSTWDVLGRAVAGPASGQQLRAVPHVDTFWFAWAAFRPDTRVVS